MKTPEGVEIGPVFVTKYALSSGLIRFDRGVLLNGGSMLEVRDPASEWPRRIYFHGKDFHRTEEDARKRMSEMLAKKIQSTEKALAKLKKVDPLSVPILEAGK